MSAAPHDPRTRAFAYLDSEKSGVYRAITAVFGDAKSRFLLYLRPAEIRADLSLNHGMSLTDEEVGAALESLTGWGNVECYSDTSDVATVEEFLRPRYLYQLTRQGEAAASAVDHFEQMLGRQAELKAAALLDIRRELRALALLCSEAEPDRAKVSMSLREVCARFDELTSHAQAFIVGLQRTIDLQGADLRAFVTYKERLIGYLERFIGELTLSASDIAGQLISIEGAGIDRMLTIAAERDLADAVAATPADRNAAATAWRSRWDGLRSWFVGGERSSHAEILRRRAREAISALLAALVAINERTMTRSDRTSDLRTLARWFAEAPSEVDSHRLWRTAFCLAPARHLGIDSESVEAYDQSPVSPRAGWLEAPPLRLSPRLRASGRYVRRGAPAPAIDRTEEKRLLAAEAEREARQIALARAALVRPDACLLSELGTLQPAEFQLFLDVLGEALAARPAPSEPVEVLSSDGTIRISLTPAIEGGAATISTSYGELTGPDCVVHIRQTAGVPC